jgi:hypothetical protein
LSNSAAVHNLLRLQKLNFVDVPETSICCESYKSLVKKISEVANINCQYQYEGVLTDLRTEILDTVTTYPGSFRSSKILTQICPNITELILYEVNGDLSNLAALKNFKTLEVSSGSYITSNLQVVLNVVGSRFSNLKLHRVIDV